MPRTQRVSCRTEFEYKLDDYCEQLDINTPTKRFRDFADCARVLFKLPVIEPDRIKEVNRIVTIDHKRYREACEKLMRGERWNWYHFTYNLPIFCPTAADYNRFGASVFWPIDGDHSVIRLMVIFCYLNYKPSSVWKLTTDLCRHLRTFFD